MQGVDTMIEATLLQTQRCRMQSLLHWLLVLVRVHDPLDSYTGQSTATISCHLLQRTMVSSRTLDADLSNPKHIHQSEHLRLFLFIKFIQVWAFQRLSLLGHSTAMRPLFWMARSRMVLQDPTSSWFAFWLCEVS